MTFSSFYWPENCNRSTCRAVPRLPLPQLYLVRDAAAVYNCYLNLTYPWYQIFSSEGQLWVNIPLVVILYLEYTPNLQSIWGIWYIWQTWLYIGFSIIIANLQSSSMYIHIEYHFDIIVYIIFIWFARKLCWYIFEFVLNWLLYSSWSLYRGNKEWMNESD